MRRGSRYSDKYLCPGAGLTNEANRQLPIAHHNILVDCFLSYLNAAFAIVTYCLVIESSTGWRVTIVKAARPTILTASVSSAL